MPAPLPRLFLPGCYLQAVKRPGATHARRQLLTDDAMTCLLLAATARPTSLRLLIGPLCLFRGFWALYELFDWDNDRCAARLEAERVLSLGFTAVPHCFPVQAPALLAQSAFLARWDTWRALSGAKWLSRAAKRTDSPASSSRQR
ncbi:hypothetical protein [Acidocella aminolytica]|uniref:Uncharacterized protein n=1 Tax=Acidocella aminolytica 101 = DSM 11237 TaxID=1120923 RepID=A0A0D6PEX6_9PROT|nr:hypothetical protein [Acidocella aminolytica]GAN80300.1 hypothetical protein Aam_044_003 [Acidocella aminolytica 101 = DSM 11237]GBQ33334.1 hypothetical protein AA11237_0407 [Acidocella aminolytica 101 = DSM 11237]SHF49516.1 hypothetical protein SAMN02746095_03465 [Acidocella aminolytica 101 = DSM 11237]